MSVVGGLRGKLSGPPSKLNIPPLLSQVEILGPQPAATCDRGSVVVMVMVIRSALVRTHQSTYYGSFGPVLLPGWV